VGAALVLASSLRAHCHLEEIDLVVLITPDVTDRGRDNLMLQYGLCLLDTYSQD